MQAPLQHTYDDGKLVYHLSLPLLHVRWHSETSASSLAGGSNSKTFATYDTANLSATSQIVKFPSIGKIAT